MSLMFRAKKKNKFVYIFLIVSFFFIYIIFWLVHGVTFFFFQSPVCVCACNV